MPDFTGNCRPRSTEVVKDYPAWKAGLKPGDVITAVDEQPVATYFELTDIIQPIAGQAPALTCQAGQAA